MVVFTLAVVVVQLLLSMVAHKALVEPAVAVMVLIVVDVKPLELQILAAAVAQVQITQHQ
jgi:hypothetical protein